MSDVHQVTVTIDGYEEWGIGERYGWQFGAITQNGGGNGAGAAPAATPGRAVRR